MGTLENLNILIDVIDSFSEELNYLLFKLGQVDTAVRAVDDITIDVDVDDDGELDLLIGKLTALEGMNMSGMGNVNVNGRGGGGGGGAVRGGMSLGGQTKRLEQMLAGLDYRLSKSLPDALDGMSTGSHEAAENMFNAAEETGNFADALVEGDIRMTDLHNALARVVPLLFVFIGALPALVGALVSLAAAAIAAGVALAALTGFAAIGMAAELGDGDIGAGFEEMMSGIREDFMDAFMPLFNRLAPLFEDGLEGLTRFFEAVASEGDALVNLSDEARDVGQWLIETMPSFLRDLAQFADASADALGAVVNGIAQMDTFGALADVLAQTLPMMMVFFGQLSKLIPHLIEFSIGFLRAANVLLYLLNVLVDFITVGGRLDKLLGTLIATAISLAGIFLILSSSILSTAGVAIGALLSAVGNAIVSLVTLDIAASKASISMYVLAGATRALAAAIALTGIGAIAVVLGAIANKAVSASTNIDDATSSLKAFERQASRMDKGNNPYGSPEVGRTGGTGSSRFAGSSVTVNVDGDADEDTLRNQTQNAMYRMERPSRSR